MLACILPLIVLLTLRRLGEEEDDMETKLMPSVDYLARLGPEYLDLIFQYSRWIFEQDRDIAFQVRPAVCHAHGQLVDTSIRSSRRKRSSFRGKPSPTSCRASDLRSARDSSSTSSTRGEKSRHYSTTDWQSYICSWRWAHGSAAMMVSVAMFRETTWADFVLSCAVGSLRKAAGIPRQHPSLSC